MSTGENIVSIIPAYDILLSKISLALVTIRVILSKAFSKLGWVMLIKEIDLSSLFESKPSLDSTHKA
jgi:hypothetical protein